MDEHQKSKKSRGTNELLLNVSSKKIRQFRMLPAILHLWMNTLCLIRPNKAFFSSLFDTLRGNNIYDFNIFHRCATSFEKEPDTISVIMWLIKMFLSIILRLLSSSLGLVNYSRVKHHLLRAGSSIRQRLISSAFTGARIQRRFTSQPTKYNNLYFAFNLNSLNLNSYGESS